MERCNSSSRPYGAMFFAVALLLPHSLAATFNSNYFSFPLLSDSVPTVHNGDTLNVSWKSGLEQASLHHWCNQALLEVIGGLTGDGNHIFTVNTTWIGPCHWQYVDAADSGNFIDSGAVDVTNQKSTPAVTWQPAGSGVACGVQTVTTSLNAGQKVTATATIISTITVDPTGATLQSLNNAGSANRDSQPQTITAGAGIGIGVAIGALGTGLVTAIVWICMRKRQNRRASEISEPPYYTYELNNSTAPLELDHRRRTAIGSAAVELPSTPKSRQSN